MSLEIDFVFSVFRNCSGWDEMIALVQSFSGYDFRMTK